MAASSRAVETSPAVVNARLCLLEIPRAGALCLILQQMASPRARLDTGHINRQRANASLRPCVCFSAAVFSFFFFPRATVELKSGQRKCFAAKRLPRLRMRKKALRTWWVLRTGMHRPGEGPILPRPETGAGESARMRGRDVGGSTTEYTGMRGRTTESRSSVSTTLPLRPSDSDASLHSPLSHQLWRTSALAHSSS